MTDEEAKVFGSALTLPPEYAEATDFKAEEAIKVDMNVKLPDNFSLGKWVYKTNYQWTIWSCTCNSTTHWVHVLTVKKNWKEPTDSNIITPNWKDLWRKMWHNPEKYEWGDYVENAMRTALKQWIANEEWWISYFDWYAHVDWSYEKPDFDLMRRYIYSWCPVVWTITWNKDLWNQMTKWEVKWIVWTTSWAHAICFVWFDKWWFWALNSWTPNDENRRKCRFYISDKTIKDLWWRMNHRYWVIYNKEVENKDPEYLKRKNWALTILQYFKKTYDQQPQDVKNAIVTLSQALRRNYPELNKELPL